jgi:hypothetical protein
MRGGIVKRQVRLEVGYPNLGSDTCGLQQHGDGDVRAAESGGAAKSGRAENGFDHDIQATGAVVQRGAVCDVSGVF